MKRPQNITSSIAEVSAELQGDVYILRFPSSSAADAVVKQRLKAPKWDPDARAWRVNAHWHASLPDAINAVAETLLFGGSVASTSPGQVEAETKPPKKIASPLSELFPELNGGCYLVRFPYSPAAVAVAKEQLKAPKWDPEARAWRVEASCHVGPARRDQGHRRHPRGRRLLDDGIQEIEAQ